MTRIMLASIILAAALSACNLPAPIPENAASTSAAPLPLQTLTSSIQDPASTATLTPPPPTPEQTSAPIVPIPMSSVQIEGVPYQAYQIPGDPFRFVCQVPCPLDERYIFAEYAGFRLAHAKMIELTGIDTLPELQPVDMHLVLEDSTCGDAPYGHAYVYPQIHQAFTCTEGPGHYPTIEEKIQKASLFAEQYFPLHEYMHTLFFGRLSGDAGNFQAYKAYFFHDFVVPIPAYAIGGLDTATFCSYRDPLAPGDFGGWLISELCQQNGFQLKDLALSLIELDKLVQSGGGMVTEPSYQHPVPTVAQYRDILNNLLQSDTTNAFAQACWPAGLFGNSFISPPACIVPTPEGPPTPVK